MAILGVRAAIDNLTPTGVDASRVFEFTVLRNTVTAGDLLRETAAIIGAVNEEIAARYADIMSFTEDMHAITSQGESTRTMTPEATEFRDADPVRTDEVGHMLPLRKFDDSVGWTEEYLMDARRTQVERDVQVIADRWRNRFDYEFIKRILTNTENAIGAGYDVPWAIGTGVNVPYTPPQWMETSFTTSHSHFVVADDTSLDYDDLFESMLAELRHHGYQGRALALVSETDLDEISAISNFVRLKPSEVTYVSGNTNAPIRYATGEFQGVPGTLFGYYESKRGLIELKYHGRIPTNYAWMTVPQGAGSPQNGPVVRLHPVVPFGLKVDPQLSKSLLPKLEMVLFQARFGVGVGNRLNGVAGYINAGAASWVNPTIS